MAITLTVPKTRQAETTVRMVSFTINAVTRYAEIGFDLGRLESGQFIRTGGRKLTFQDDNPDADFTFQQLISNITEVRQLRQALG